MNHLPQHKPLRLTAPPAAVAVKTAPAIIKTVDPQQEKMKRLLASPHLLDLTPLVAKLSGTSAAKVARKSSWQQLLDQHIHLRDVRDRRLSLHPRGWRDFPPRAAVSLSHAVILTLRHFFEEHPLADLTVLTLVHITVAVLWHLLSWPFVTLARALGYVAKPAPLPILLIDEEEEVLTATTNETVPITPPLRHSATPPLLFAWRPTALSLAAAALVFTLPFGAWSAVNVIRDSQSEVVSRSAEAVRSLEAGAEAVKTADFSAAQANFAAAADLFIAAKRRLGVTGNVVSMTAAALAPDAGVISAATPVLTAGQELAEGGAALAQGVMLAERSSEPVQAIDTLREHLNLALPHLAAAENSLKMVDASVLPDEYRGTLAQARERLPVLNAYAAKAAAVAKLLPGIIGADGRRRYLVIFQNDAELRPTGGFMGSYALVDVNNGRLTQVEIPGGGSYDIQGQMPLKLISPQPLHLVNPHWQFQDANWSPDFPTAAKTITRFFEAGTKTSVDGVIALNIPVVEKLLEIIGPVPMPEYGKTIDHRNFYFETQKAVEIDYDKEANRPKKFLADLAPRIIDKTLKADRGQMIAIAQALDEALRLKQAQLWFRHGDEQQAVGELGWDGAMKTTGGDFLALVHSNIAGQKTDRVMRDEVSHEAKIMADGTTIVTLTLKRVHAGESGALFSGVRNVDFLRVYVPAGSVLVEAKGFTPPDPKLFKIPEPGYAVDGELAAAEESLRVDAASGTRVYVEGGRTVFGNWLQTDPGQSSIATLVYQLPPNAVRILPPERRWLDRLQGRQSESDRLDYRLTIFKQSGADRTTFTQSLDLPRGYILDDETGRTEDDRGRLVTSFPLQSDTELRALLEMP